MFRRSALIATIQIALATSAVAGVASVFMRQSSMAGRTAATALVVLVGAMCLLPLGRPSSDGRISALEIFWTGFIGIGALLTLGLIWSVMPTTALRDLLLMADLAWVGYGVPTAMVLVTALRRRATPSRVAYPASSRVAVFGAGTVFLAAVAIQLLMDWLSPSRTNFAPPAFSVSLPVVVLISANLASFQTPRVMGRAGSTDRIIGVVGVIACIVAWVGWMWIVVLETQLLQTVTSFTPPLHHTLNSGSIGPTVGFTGVAISGALWCALRAARFRGWSSAIPGIAAGLTLALAGIVTLAVTEQGLPDPIRRVAIALAIMDATALLTAVLVLRSSRSSSNTEDFLKPIDGLPMKCPRCSAPRVAPIGESACALCGLVLLLAVRDDRCPACRYDLRGNAEPRCPECGRLRQLPTTPTAD